MLKCVHIKKSLEPHYPPPPTPCVLDTYQKKFCYRSSLNYIKPYIMTITKQKLGTKVVLDIVFYNYLKVCLDHYKKMYLDHTFEDHK